MCRLFDRRSCYLACTLAIAAMSTATPCGASADLAPPVFRQTGPIQEGVAIGDLDGDGDNDLAIVHRDGALSTVTNLGGGLFASAVGHGVLWPSDPVTDLVIADVDRDSDADLIVAVATLQGALSVVLNRGDGTFDPQLSYDTCYSTQMVVAADLDNDKRVDAAGDSNCFQASILLNNGDGSFRDNGDYGQGYTPGGIDAGDLDHDGDRDIVYGNGTSDVTVLLNDGSGVFVFAASIDVGDNPQAVKLADLDRDGDIDVMTSNYYSHFISALMNDGSGSFAPVTHYIPGDGTENLAVADFDGDEDLDAVVANRDHHHLSILHNQGNGTFAERRDEPAGLGPEDVAAGDLDGDALLDVVATHWNDSRVAIYLNATVVVPDADGDGVRDADDCAPTNAAAWLPPSAIDDLLLDGAPLTRLSWSAPAQPGAPTPRYDILRSADPSDFGGATRLETSEIDRVGFDDQTPGTLFAYIVRVTNACGGNAGSASDGTPRAAAPCP